MGIAHFFRVSCVSLQAVAVGVLAGLNISSVSAKLFPLIALFLVALLLVLPLQFVETTRSAVSQGSLISHWFANMIVFLTVCMVDLVSPHKVFIAVGDKNTVAFAYALELVILVNSVLMYYLESYYYTPSVELKEYYHLRGWDISSIKNLTESLTFSYLNPLLQEAYETSLVSLNDIPPSVIELDNEVTALEFNERWLKELKRAIWWRDRRVRNKTNPTEKDMQPQPSLLFTLLCIHWPVLLKGFVFDVADMTCLAAAPLVLQKFIIYFADVAGENDLPAPPMIKGFAFAIGIYLCSVLRYFLTSQYNLAFSLCSLSIKSTLSVRIYEKAMRLSSESRDEKGVGEIVNHISVDINEISFIIENSSDAITIPVRLVLSLFALWKLLGNSMWAGLATVVVFIPLGSFITKKLYDFYNEQMKYKDERSKLTSEILNSIKSIKFYSWELPMMKKLDEVRNKKELNSFRKVGIYDAGSQFLWSCIPFFVSCAVYTCYALVSNMTLVPSVIFPALALFDLLSEPVLLLPYIFSNIAEAKVAIERVAKFLVMEERAADIVKRTYNASKANDVNVEIKNATFVWSRKTTESHITLDKLKVALKDINFQARKGRLTCIVGRVGAGKSSILNAILGFLPLIENPNASVSANGRIAYCPQNPCVLNATIRENILFGKKFDADFYAKTVEACQLKSDLEFLPSGDATIVGDRGISLSVGQRARVSLARALYSRAEIYLLDDVLSAVDAHVAKKITQKVLGPRGFLALKTLILATNSVKILNLANEIVFLEKGQITERGSYEELTVKDSEVSRLVKEFADKPNEKNKLEEDDDESEVTPALDTTRILALRSSNEPATYVPEDSVAMELFRVASNKTIGGASMVSFGHEYVFEDFKLQANKEVHEKGSVKWSVYLNFFHACNWVYIIVWLVFCFGVVQMSILGNWILKYWSEKNLDAGENVSSVLYLLLYFSTGIAGALLTYVGLFIIWTFSAIASSRYYHDTMAMAILRSPMSFFDTTPIGQILNRFSDDISSIDQDVLWNLMLLASSALECVSRLGIIVINLPLMAVVIVLLVVLYNYFRGWFMPAMRQLKRLRTTQRSPIFSHLQESINDVETLRAYDEVDRFTHSMESKVSMVTKVDWSIQCCNRWLSMRLESIAAIIVLTSSFTILAGSLFGRQMSPSMVGFIMTYVLTSTSRLNAIVRMWAQCEVKAVNLERVIEYINLPPEADSDIEGHRPPATWPANGSIQFNDYSCRYRKELDYVLKNISFKIKPAEKVGIVGRTGAGKSSLTLALFRIIEPDTGNVEIDQINTSDIGLFDLRSHLNIIPQDAHAFDGSVRENLDPFGNFTDRQLWKVLEMAHLKTHVESMKTEIRYDEESQYSKDKDHKAAKSLVGLDAKVLEGGSNLSSGQKQLLCLARALLKESRVLILDEATAAVDVQTDKIIQETIRTEFQDKTILTIAHRLDTIIDSDRVLVLDRGTIREFDTPAKLLADKSSEFYSLCKEGGYLDENDNIKSKAQE